MDSTQALFLVGLLALFALVIVLRVLRPTIRGARGQAAVSRELRTVCAEVADDLIVPNGRGGLTQIDHLALTGAGLLVVETKNYGGLIFGQARDRAWTQCIGRQRRRFGNPIWQNYGHIKAIQLLADGVPVTGLVVFTDRAMFPKGEPNGVATLSALRSAIESAEYPSGQGDYRKAWDAVVAKARRGREARQQHLESIRRRTP